MRIDGKAVIALAAGAIVLVGVAYVAGLKQGQTEQVAATSPAPATAVSESTRESEAPRPQGDSAPAGHPPIPTTAVRAGPLRPGATVPANHPPTASATASPRPTPRPGIKFTHFRVGNRNIKAMLPDGNIMWVGTSGGVIRYDTSTDQYRVFDVRSGLLSNGIFHLSKLGDRLAVGTYGGGLSLLDPTSDTWQNLNIQHGLGDAFVYDVLQASNGDVWIATWSGANRVRGGALEDRTKWDLYTVENTGGGLPNDWVYGLAEGEDGVVWLATEGGLARFANDEWTNWGHAEGLGAPFEQVRDQIEFKRDPAKESSHHARQKVEQGLGQVDVAYNPNYIVALVVDESGVVWCGTWGGGLGRFDGTSWRNFTTADGLPSNHVFMLSRDGKGRLWVGTSRGLAHFDGSSFKTYTTADGLFADNVFSLATDPKGTLWVGSYGGVARISGLDAPL